jgi:nicotinamide riboside kinase
MLHIAITGPESSGKTTLAAALAAHFGVPWVPEYARSHLAGRQGYVEADLLAIAQGQHQAGRELAEGPVLFHDTDMITIRIWSLEKFGRVDPAIERLVHRVHYDHWFLCRPDLPWEPDPLRENPHDRDRLFTLYEENLHALQRPYTIMEGPHAVRMQAAVAVVKELGTREG